MRPEALGGVGDAHASRSRAFDVSARILDPRSMLDPLLDANQCRPITTLVPSSHDGWKTLDFFARRRARAWLRTPCGTSVSDLELGEPVHAEIAPAGEKMGSI